MENESEFRTWMRHFEEHPNETLINYADELYRQEPGSLIRHIILGGICGLLCYSAVVSLIIVAADRGVVGESVSSDLISIISSKGGWAGLWFSFLFGGGLGGSLWKRHERRAVRLRAIALVALALARIEVKLNKLEESGKPSEHDSQPPSQSAI